MDLIRRIFVFIRKLETSILNILNFMATDDTPNISPHKIDRINTPEHAGLDKLAQLRTFFCKKIFQFFDILLGTILKYT